MNSLRTAELDVHRIREQFDLSRSGRIVTNNAASTQPPRQLLDLYRSLVPSYENVHRGQSSASKRTTELFEESFDTIAGWLNAPSRRCIATYRNTTEAHNAVMYSLLTEFRDGDNIVTTMLEHNSNFVPWHALCREILPRLGRRVELRIARFDHETGQLDLEHLRSMVDERTKLVCCTGASNFLGTKPDLAQIREIADSSGYPQPDGELRSRLLVDGAQLVPSNHIDVRAMDVDYLSFSFHKFMAPFGVGVLYAKEHLLQNSLPFLYGGDMIAEGQVSADAVAYNELPWKYSAGTPNILGVIASAQALRYAVDLVGVAGPPVYFRSRVPIPADAVAATMTADRRPHPPAHRFRHACTGQHPRHHDLRAVGGAPPLPAGRVQCGRSQPVRDRRAAQRRRGGVTRGLPLRHPGPPRTRPRSRRQLPAQLLPVQLDR